MLLPGENYSEQLMFTMEGYRDFWADSRAANLYAETYSSLEKASNLSKSDRSQIKELKKGLPASEIVDFGFEVFDTARKGLRFSKAAAPLILADGPLPFGDVVFVIALGLDFAIAAYNLVTDDD
jgi:hypothetical protein